MEECELLMVDTEKPMVQKRLERCDQNNEEFIEETIDTPHGYMVVARHGARYVPGSSRHVILTFHDLGLNYLSQFQSFFNYHAMKPVLDRMTVMHLTAPGQEECATDLPDDYEYPSMEVLAEMVLCVCKHYRLRHTIGLGIGVGANVLVRFALLRPELVDGLFLVNPVSTIAGWVEWAYQKWNIYQLFQHSARASNDQETPFPQSVLDYLIWHHFGTTYRDSSLDLINMYKSYFASYTRKINSRNLALIADSYLRRTDIGIDRMQTNTNRQLECPTLILVGNDSPHLDDTVTFNARLSPEHSTWMKLFDCGMPLDEQPHRVTQALILFIQGLGLGLLTCLRTTAKSTVTTSDMIQRSRMSISGASSQRLSSGDISQY